MGQRKRKIFTPLWALAKIGCMNSTAWALSLLHWANELKSFGAFTHANRGVERLLLIGGAIRYQATSVSAAAWRRFILLFLESRIVGRDAFSLLENVHEAAVELRYKVWRSVLQHSSGYVLAKEGTYIG
jgi:hypothetical protein